MRLGELTNDNALEGVVLGLVYTRPELQASEKETRSSSGQKRRDLSRENEEKKEGERSCLEEATRSVELNRQMEGILEVNGGKLGFLVYRVD